MKHYTIHSFLLITALISIVLTGCVADKNSVRHKNLATEKLAPPTVDITGKWNITVPGGRLILIQDGNELKGSFRPRHNQSGSGGSLTGSITGNKFTLKISLKIDPTIHAKGEASKNLLKGYFNQGREGSGHFICKKIMD